MMLVDENKMGGGRNETPAGIANQYKVQIMQRSPATAAADGN